VRLKRRRAVGRNTHDGCATIVNASTLISVVLSEGLDRRTPDGSCRLTTASWLCLLRTLRRRRLAQKTFSVTFDLPLSESAQILTTTIGAQFAPSVQARSLVIDHRAIRRTVRRTGRDFAPDEDTQRGSRRIRSRRCVVSRGLPAQLPLLRATGHGGRRQPRRAQEHEEDYKLLPPLVGHVEVVRSGDALAGRPARRSPSICSPGMSLAISRMKC
jgi:hypothetical protein